MTLNHRTAALLKLIKQDESGELRYRSYSGRAMYGDACLAITAESLSSVFANLMALALEAGDNLTGDEKDDCIMALTRGVCTDSMGTGVVVYFPGAKFTRQDELADKHGAEEEDESDDEEEKQD